MGLLEVLPQLRRLRGRLAETAADIAARRPGVLVTIDSPGFTLRLLRRVRGLGVPRVHYVAPQVWAWREGRVRRFPGLWERLLCLLPFEPAFFARHNLPAHFVGHPVLESGADQGDAARFRARHGLDPATPDTGADAGQPSGRGDAAAAGLSARRWRCSPRAFPNLVPVVPIAAAVAATVRQATATWPVPAGDRDRHRRQARRLRRRRRGPHQVRHLHAGTRARRRADGGDVSRQPADRDCRARADPGAAMWRW